MIYYNENNKEINISDDIFNHYIDDGCCGSTYRLNETTCFKIYDKDIEAENIYMSTFLYHLLEDINSSNLAKIFELLFKNKDTFHYYADAYLVKYYQKFYEDFLTAPSTYLIENLELLIDLCIKCSDKYIILDDLKEKNSIFTEKRIIFIDYEHYIYDKSISKKEIRKINISNLALYFNYLLRESLYNKHRELAKFGYCYSYITCDKLFPITSNPNKLQKTLTKRLTGYKSPLEYLKQQK